MRGNYEHVQDISLNVYSYSPKILLASLLLCTTVFSPSSIHVHLSYAFNVYAELWISCGKMAFPKKRDEGKKTETK